MSTYTEVGSGLTSYSSSYTAVAPATPMARALDAHHSQRERSAGQTMHGVTHTRPRRARKHARRSGGVWRVGRTSAMSATRATSASGVAVGERVNDGERGRDGLHRWHCSAEQHRSVSGSSRDNSTRGFETHCGTLMHGGFERIRRAHIGGGMHLQGEDAATCHFRLGGSSGTNRLKDRLKEQHRARLGRVEDEAAQRRNRVRASVLGADELQVTGSAKMVVRVLWLVNGSTSHLPFEPRMTSVCLF